MNEEFYNSVSDFDLQKGGYYPQKIAFFKKELAGFSKGKKEKPLILDLACNEGGLSKIYSQFGKVYGIDMNESAVKKAKEAGVEAICGDVMEIEKIFPEKKFDIVIAGDIVEHIFDTDLFLEKINKILKEGGALFLSTPNLVSLGRRAMALVGKNPYCEYSSKNDGINVGHIRYYTYGNLYSQLKEKGFRNVSIKSDTANIPLGIIDSWIVSAFPSLGRELLAKAYK